MAVEELVLRSTGFRTSPLHERAPYQPGHPTETRLTDYRNGGTDTDDSPLSPMQESPRYVPYFPANRVIVRLILIWKQSNQRQCMKNCDGGMSSV
jgi:hypothetical protein